MKVYLLVLILCVCSIQSFYSQEDDGVVSLVIPSRNSLTFNRFAINPTFSFVREQTKYVSIYNKREWVQFENAPLTYLASYSGRFAENIGAGIGLFQQNYGVLTTFGGILNFAYNARLDRNSNLTFGLNVGAYKSGINTSNIVTNFDDPSLQNVPENILLTINPGINYGTEFLDFGVSVNDLALYNFESSELIQDNPEQSIQAHVMYTGYIDSKGFFDESKFSGLLRSEFQKEETIISAIAMVTVPKGIWAQAGYNTLYGASGGLGLNITNQIAIEYNFETAFGDLQNFGPSHEVTLAYRFKNNNYYNYSREDEVSSILSGGNKRRRNFSRKTKSRTASSTAKVRSEAKAKAKLLAQQQAKEKEIADEEARLMAEQNAQQEKLAQAKLIEEQKAKAKIEAEEKAGRIAATRAKIEADQKAKKDAEAKAALLAEQKVKAEAEAQAQAKLIEEQKAQEEAARQAQLLAEQKAQEEAQLLAEQKAKKDLFNNPTDDLGKSLKELTEQTEESKIAQTELLRQLDDIITIKDKDLKDLKKENDLSDQGITVQPKPFKSVTAENNALNAIKTDLDKVIKSRSEKLEELKSVYNQRTRIKNTELDEVNLFYRDKIKRLTEEQLKAIETRATLDAKLEMIAVATEFEKRRRIKRAAFDNEEDKYTQDRAMLQNIKRTTKISDTPPKAEDFDFGEDQGDNIKILKNINNVESGYYLIIAVHNNINKRNDFVTKVVASGRKDVDFFYDVNTSKYYIYYSKFDFIEQANEAIKTKGNSPYNGKMSIVKINN